jgi:two-component system, sensor histidine kinase YesM
MRSRMLSFFQQVLDRIIYDLKLQYKLIIAFSVIMLIPLLLLGFTSANLMQQNIQAVEKKALLQSMRQTNLSVDSFLYTYLNASTMLQRNYELQQALDQKTNNLKDAIEGRQKIIQIVRQVQTGLALSENSGVGNIQSDVTVRFYVTNNPFASYLGDVLSLDNVKDEAWFPQVYTPGNTSAWQSRVLLNGQPNIVLNRKITNFQDYVPIGVMRVFIPVSVFKNFVDRNVPSGIYRYFYVDSQYQDILNAGIGPEDNLLAAIRERKFTSEFNTLTVDGHGYIVGIITSSLTGWRLILVTPTDAITATTRAVSTVTLLSAVIALVLCFFISILVSRLLTSRMAVLVNKTNQVDKGNFTIQQTIRGRDEVGQLDMNFNRMVTRVDNLIQNEFRAKLAINKVRLELLQEQINPHLLYNTLSLISMISQEDGRQEVLNVTNRLIAFYKGILSRGKIITSIREEMAMVTNYVEIMRTVYQLDIDCIVEIEDEIFDCYTIKLLLQPVVENAILHGLRQKGGGQIFISGITIENGLEFVVTDDGVGMSAEIKNFLNSVLEVDHLEKSYGLANVIKRVDLFWGRAYCVRVESAPETGTTVTLRIPRLSEAEISQRLESKYLS